MAVIRDRKISQDNLETPRVRKTSRSSTFSTDTTSTIATIGQIAEEESLEEEDETEEEETVPDSSRRNSTRSLNSLFQIAIDQNDEIQENEELEVTKFEIIKRKLSVKSMPHKSPEVAVLGQGRTPPPAGSLTFNLSSRPVSREGSRKSTAPSKRLSRHQSIYNSKASESSDSVPVLKRRRSAHAALDLANAAGNDQAVTITSAPQTNPPSRTLSGNLGLDYQLFDDDVSPEQDQGSRRNSTNRSFKKRPAPPIPIQAGKDDDDLDTSPLTDAEIMKLASMFQQPSSESPQLNSIQPKTSVSDPPLQSSSARPSLIPPELTIQSVSSDEAPSDQDIDNEAPDERRASLRVDPEEDIDDDVGYKKDSGYGSQGLLRVGEVSSLYY